MTSTFIRAFAIMLALTGFSATTYTSASSSSSGSHKAMSGTGLGGQPICTTTTGNCGLD